MFYVRMKVSVGLLFVLMAAAVPCLAQRPAWQGHVLRTTRMGDVLLPGEKIELVLGKQKKKSVFVTFREEPPLRPEKTVFAKEFRITPGADARLVLPVDTSKLRYGIYSVQVRGMKWRHEGRGDHERLLIAIVPPPLENPEKPARLGVCLYSLQKQHAARGEDVVDLMKRLGIRSVKLRCPWADIEPKKGVFNWKKHDRDLDLFHKAGFLVGTTVTSTPRWASKAPRNTKRGAEYAGYRTYPPKKMGDWDAFIRRVAERYKGRLSFFEIWNEPGGPNFYRGSTKDFVRLVKGASKAFREVSPDTKLLVSGYHRFMPFEKDIWKQTFDDFDIASIHYETAFNLVKRSRSFLKGLGGKPIWNTEAMGLKKDPVKTIVENRARGIEYIFLYKFYVQNRKDRSKAVRLRTTMLGLEMELTGTAGRALFFRTASDMLDRTAFEKKTVTGGRHEYRFSKKGGGTLIVAWSSSKGDAEIELPENVKQAVDALGNPLPVEKDNLKLTRHPVFVVTE